MSRTLESLADVVAPQVLLDALEASRRLRELGVPHALIGGLAVGIHGHPRATNDADFLVGNEAFKRRAPLLVYREELKDLVRVGVIDLMPLPERHQDLAAILRVPAADEVPVVPVETLVLLKLRANRAQDHADVGALLTAGADPTSIAAYLREHSPELVERFAEVVSVLR